jgi:hypothetical protein
MTSEREAQITLQRALGFLTPEPADEARVLAGLQQRLADGGASAPLEPRLREPAAHARASLGRGIAAKLVVVGALTGVVGFVLGYVAGQQSSLEPIEVRAAPAVVVAPSPLADATPAYAPSPPSRVIPEEREVARPAEPRTRPRVTPPRAAKVRRSDVALDASDPLDLREALALLRQAQAAAAESRPGAALELLSELDRRAPKEMLAEERLVTRILAQCDLGDKRTAQRLSSELFAHNPSSIYSARVRQSCANEPPAPAEKR